MKRSISLLLVVLVLLGGTYGGLWYYGCMRLDERLSKKDFSFAFGPDKDVAMTVKIDRGPSRYIGWQRGELGVEFDVKSVSSTSSVKMPQQTAPQLSSAIMSAGDKPWVTKVSVPLWGSSLRFDVAPFKEARHETKVADKSFAFLQSAEAGRMTIEFRDAQLALSREKQIDAMIADPKRIVDDVAGFDLVSKTQVLNAEDKKVLMEGTVNGGGLHWTIGSDGMLSVRYDADSEINYGPGFFDLIGAQAVVPEGVDPEAAQRFEGFMKGIMKIQQALMAGSSFVSKGAVEVTLPANRIGLRDSAAASDTGFPVPPFEVKFDRLKFRLPFVWSSLTSVDGTVGFMWNGAKPIAVNLTQEADALDVQPALDELLKVAQGTPEFQNLGLDMARVTPSSLVSLKEVESEQGAFVLAQSAVRALSKAYFSQKVNSALKVDVKTNSGNANVFELMGAPATWNARTKLGNGFGVELDGSADGAKSWKTTLTIYELLQLLRELRAPLMLFGARAGLATFFSSDQVSGTTNPQEKELLAFFFSDELFEDLLAALGRVLRVVDQTPDSTSDLKLLLEGSGSDVSINGKKAEELQQALMPVVMQEVQALQSKLEPRLSELRLAAQQAVSVGESVEPEGGEEVQWQEAPTEEGAPSEEINEE